MRFQWLNGKNATPVNGFDISSILEMLLYPGKKKKGKTEWLNALKDFSNYKIYKKE